jgi:diketogulonate reductase-like aldo/keto reductase
VLKNETVQIIAKTHNVTPAQVALAWLLAQDALPIPKAIDKSHIDENIKSVEITLTQKDMQTLSAII